MTSSENKCHHCHETYFGEYASHWNNCIPSRCASHSFPEINMFSDRPDFAQQKQNPLLERYRKCEYCLSEYSCSKQDHEDRCSVIGMRRANDVREIPLFQTKQETEQERLNKLQKEVEELKSRLKVE